MNKETLIKEMIAEYRAALPAYTVMQRYYNGDHDIVYKVWSNPKRCNKIAVENFISKFVDEEVNYVLGNALSFVSKTGNTDEIKAIDDNLFHWRTNHNALMMRDLEIYGKVYALSYIDRKGRYCERILNPTNAIAYCDDDNVPLLFIHFYKKKYDSAEYFDVYDAEGNIDIYKNGVAVDHATHLFGGCPASVCEMENISETIFSKIRHLQDTYNDTLSDQASIIGDYRNAYLVVTGVEVTDEISKKLENYGLLNLPPNKNADVHWLMKEMNDTYIQNVLDDLRNAMYSVCNHIDGNEKLQSNTSALAIRSRLVFLEQRSKSMFDYVQDAIYDRIERLFEYLALKGYAYDVSDVQINYSPNVPTDITTIVQAISQLGDRLSTETALSLLPFIENPTVEMEKIRKEREAEETIDLDKIE